MQFACSAPRLFLWGKAGSTYLLPATGILFGFKSIIKKYSVLLSGLPCLICS
jgi:hypothetical protein